MRTIHKFVLHNLKGGDPACYVDMPKGAKVVHVGLQMQRVCVWADVDPKAGILTRCFYLYGTGHAIDPAHRYLGTTQDGPFVWHVFEA